MITAPGTGGNREFQEHDRELFRNLMIIKRE